jgi:hypothetical protein
MHIPKIFPVNSMHASAPRCTLWSAKENRRGDGATYVVGWRNLALVNWHNCTTRRCHSSLIRTRPCNRHSRWQSNTKPRYKPPEDHAGNAPGESLDCSSDSKNNCATEESTPTADRVADTPGSERSDCGASKRGERAATWKRIF